MARLSAAVFAVTEDDNGKGAADNGGLSIDLNGSGMFTDRMLQIIALVTVLSIAPSILIMMTSFVRIVVVLSLLRTALGLQQSPPNSVIISLAMFLASEDSSYMSGQILHPNGGEPVES